MSASATTASPLFTPIKVGQLELSTRLVYAPLTRTRAIDNVPQPSSMGKYYEQRAFPGALMITEATVISKQGRGYPHTPGIWSDEKVINAWKPIVQGVHDKGAYFFLQLWHCGRASLPDYQVDNAQPVGPSAIAIGGDNKAYSPVQNNMVEYGVPRPLEVSEIKDIIQEFAQGAKNAIAAGFDGVELHGANGYLLDQFLKSSSNKRTDEYGGSIEKRCRFTLEVVDAVTKAVGSDKVGIRLSPYSWTFLDCREEDAAATVKLNTYLLQQLQQYNLAYVHIVTARVAGSADNEDKNAITEQTLTPFRQAYNGNIIAAGGFVKETAEQEIKAGNADLIAMGRWWLANPDYVERIKQGAPLNKYNRDTFYSQDPVVGYTDYPFLNEIPKDTPTEKHYSGETVFGPPPHKDDKGGDQPWTSVA